LCHSLTGPAVRDFSWYRSRWPWMAEWQPTRAVSAV